MSTKMDKHSGRETMPASAIGQRKNESRPEHALPLSGIASTVVGEIGDAEEGNIRIRLIALENLVVALLAGAPEGQHKAIREMASYILPREGKTLHRLTTEAARNMVALLDRADQFKKRAASGDA